MVSSLSASASSLEGIDVLKVPSSLLKQGINFKLSDERGALLCQSIMLLLKTSPDLDSGSSHGAWN